MPTPGWLGVVLIHLGQVSLPFVTSQSQLKKPRTAYQQLAGCLIHVTRTHPEQSGAEGWLILLDWCHHVLIVHLLMCCIVFFWFCRSGKGGVHIWNLNSRRAEKVLDGHGGTSVIWVSTLQTAENLIRWGRGVGGWRGVLRTEN